jgi:hypothetical protein
MSLQISVAILPHCVYINLGQGQRKPLWMCNGLDQLGSVPMTQTSHQSRCGSIGVSVCVCGSPLFCHTACVSTSRYLALFAIWCGPAGFRPRARARARARACYPMSCGVPATVANEWRVLWWYNRGWCSALPMITSADYCKILGYKLGAKFNPWFFAVAGESHVC